MHMCFKSWLYDSLMLQDWFDEENEKEEDYKADETHNYSYKDDTQDNFFNWSKYCIWCKR